MRRWLFLIIMLLSAPAWAATYWVSKSSTGDGNACNNSATPLTTTAKLTIAGGKACLAPGDTLNIRAGTYNEDVNISSSGTNWTTGLKTIKAAPQETVIFPHIEWNCNPCYTELAGVIVDKDVSGAPSTVTVGHGNGSTFYRMRNVELRGGTQGYLLGVGTHDIELLGVNSHHHSMAPNGSVSCPNAGECHGLYAVGYNLLIEGGDFHHNHGYGIQFRIGPDSNVTIRNNKFHDNTTGGIIAFTGTYEFYNNLSYNTGTGVWVVGTPGNPSKVYGNTVTGNTGGNGGIFVRGDEGYVDIINNIAYNNNVNINLETTTGVTQTTNTTSNPGFVQGFGSNPDFHIAAFGSSAVNAGTNLPAQYMVDAENHPRPLNQVTTGAYQFITGSSPSPNIIALYKADGNANDSAGYPGGPFNGTLTLGTLANGAPIVSGNSFVFDGIDDYVNVPGNATLRPAAFGVSLWVNSTTPTIDEGCNAIRMGNAWSMGWEQNGRAFCWVNFGPTATMATGNILNGTNQMLACAYDPAASGPGIRLWQGNGQVAFTSVSAAISYTGSENLTIGGNPSGGFNCAGRIDEVTVANFAWQQSDIDALFGVVTPSSGVSQTHQRYSVANATEGNWIGLEDTNQSRSVALPWGVRWSLHNATGSPVTENYRVYCRINHAPGGWGAWTELTNSSGAFGLRYLTDSAVNLGDPTTPLLTLDGFTGVPGKYLADVVDVVGPDYNAAQKITFPNGGHAELEARMEALSPVSATDLVQCKPYGENGLVLPGGYGTADVNIRTLTLTGLPSVVRLGGTTQGGSSQ